MNQETPQAASSGPSPGVCPLAAMRTRAGGEVWLADSSDDGKTWGEPRKLTPARVHPADLLVPPDQRVLLMTSYRAGPFGVRGLVGGRGRSVRVGPDGEKTGARLPLNSGTQGGAVENGGGLSLQTFGRLPAGPLHTAPVSPAPK